MQTPGHTATAPGPLTALEIAKQFPTLGISLGDQRPHVPGKIREYLPLLAPTQLSVVFRRLLLKGPLRGQCPRRRVRPVREACQNSVSRTRSGR
ncbi:hypothetical protein GCM10018965_008340 [Nonomuraea roseola]